MKLTIEVEVPEGVDLDHAYQSVTDALHLSSNVRQEEGNLVASMLNQLAKEKSASVLKRGFRYWAETHHQIVVTMYEILDYNRIEYALMESMDVDGAAGLHELGIELTNEFCRMYENEEWDGDWAETINFFLHDKLA